MPREDDDIIGLFFHDNLVVHDGNMRAGQKLAYFFRSRKLGDVGHERFVDPVVVDQHRAPSWCRIRDKPFALMFRFVGECDKLFSLIVYVLPPLRPSGRFKKFFCLGAIACFFMEVFSSKQSQPIFI